MKIIRCPNCGQTYSPNSAIYCAKCGDLLPEQPREITQAPGNGWVRFLGGLCVFVGIAVFVAYCISSYHTYSDKTISEGPVTFIPVGLVPLESISGKPEKKSGSIIFVAHRVYYRPGIGMFGGGIDPCGTGTGRAIRTASNIAKPETGRLNIAELSLRLLRRLPISSRLPTPFA